MIGWRAGLRILALVGIVYAFVLAPAFGGLQKQRCGERSSEAGTRALFRFPLYPALAAAYFCFCGVLWIVYAWLPNLLYERFRLSLSQSGLEATLYIQASCVAGVVAGGWLADRMAPKIPAARLYITGGAMLLSAPFAYLAVAAPSIAQFRLCAVAFGFIAGMNIANVFAAAYDAIGDRSHGLAGGVLTMTGGVSGGVTMYLAGLWKTDLGIPALTAWAVVFTLLAAAVLVAMAWRFGVPARAGTSAGEAA
jgi:MFS family permease